MADDERSGGGAAAAAQVLGAPPNIDDSTMEDILFKLKILNYETEFVRAFPQGNFKPLNRAYFVAASDNASHQFFYFVSLCSWLTQLSNSREFPPPAQFDDPNATSTNLLSALRSLDVASRDIAPTRLRQGSGDAVLTVLSLLVDKALITKGFSFRQIEYPPAAPERDTADVDDLRGAQSSAAIAGGSDAIDDRVVDVDSDEDDDVFVKGGAGGAQKADDEDYIVPQVSADAWKLEVERVAPVLQYRTDDANDWRSRVESAQVLHKAVEKMYPDIRAMLERMGDDIAKVCERIQKREQTLASQFQEHVGDYRNKLRELNSAQDQLNEAGKSVSQLSAELNAVSEQLENVKAQIVEREEKSTDVGPLTRIKESVIKVRSEIKEMALRIGILQHTTLQFTLRQSRAKRTAKSGYDNADSSLDVIHEAEVAA